MSTKPPSASAQERAIAEKLPAIGEGMEIALKQVSGCRQGFLLMVFTPTSVQHVMNIERAYVREQVASLFARWDAEPPHNPQH